MANKELIIIGAGVAGLSAGVYAAKSGFKTTILESHVIPGGLSTSWSRKGYFFEGGMHWLTGSSEELALNKVWKETGALQENNPIYNKDPFYTLVKGDKQLHLYRDIDKLAKHFIEYAPEDKKTILKFVRDVKCFKGVHMMVYDIPGVKVQTAYKPGFLELIKMLPALLILNKLRKQTYQDYVAQFKNPDIRELLLTVIGLRYNALSFVYTIASFSTGDCGYPKGGSLQMAKNMAETFEKLGGTIKYRTKVNKIIIKDGKVTGVETNNGIIPATNVMVCQDTRKAIDTLFEKDLEEKWIKTMRKNVVSEQNMFVCLGVKADLKHLPVAAVYPLKKPLNLGGLDFTSLRINNYATYDGYSPKGCTTLTCLLLGKSYEYWKEAKENGTYKEKKNQVANDFINALTEFIPELKDNVEAIDVATPMTYERYCDTYHGGWMSVWLPGGKSISYPYKSSTVKGLYFASQRTLMPGGLPIAVSAGRFAVQHLCKDNKTVFVSK